MKRKPLRSLVVLVALTSLFLIPGTSSAADTPGVITGTVLLPDSTPTAGAWVGLRVLDDPVGVQEPVPYLDQATSDPNGHFSLTIPNSPELIALASANDGILNLELSGETTSRDGSTLVGTVLSTVILVYNISVALGAVFVETGNSQSGFVLQQGNTVTLTLAEIDTYTTNASETYRCTRIRQTVEAADPNIVIGEYHVYEDQTGWFQYGRTADSELGVGYKGGGKNWKVSGTVHMGQTRSAYVRWDRGPFFGKQLQSNFHYIKEKIDTVCESGYTRTDYVIRATRWNSGSAEGDDVSGWDGTFAMQWACSGCALGFSPNSQFHRSATDSYTYTREIVVFTVGLSAKSGFSTNVQSHWNFGSQPWTHYLIGKDGPPTTAKIIYSW